MTMQQLARAGMCAAVLALSACAADPPVSPVTAPPALGLTDPANAIAFTSWAFALPSRTHGQPGVAARAVAALDYPGAVLNTNPQWRAGSPIISAEMLRARSAARRALGIAPNATSQEVVNALTTVSVALARSR